MSVVPLVAVVAPAAGNLVVVAAVVDTRPVVVLVGILAGNLVVVAADSRRYIRLGLAPAAGCSGSGPDTRRRGRQSLSHTRAGLVGSRSCGF